MQLLFFVQHMGLCDSLSCSNLSSGPFCGPWMLLWCRVIFPQGPSVPSNTERYARSVPISCLTIAEHWLVCLLITWNACETTRVCKAKTQTTIGMTGRSESLVKGTMWLSSCSISRQAQKSLSNWNVWVASVYVFVSDFVFGKLRWRGKKEEKLKKKEGRERGKFTEASELLQWRWD